MDHRKVGFENGDANTVLGVLRSAETIMFGNTEVDVKIPVDISLVEEDAPHRVVVPLGGDGEALFVSANMPPLGPSVITLIGEIAAEPVGNDSFWLQVMAEESSDPEHESIDELFDEWTGEYGGFLRTVITIEFDEESRENKISGAADFAIVETPEEFEEYSHEPDGGVRAFAHIDSL